MKKFLKKIKNEIEKVKCIGISCVLFDNLFKITKLSFFAVLKHKSILKHLNRNLKDGLNNVRFTQSELIQKDFNIWIFLAQGFQNVPELAKKI